MTDNTPVTTTPGDNQAVESFDINIKVEPGHDMVINHLDGSQELGTAEERIRVEKEEGTAGSHQDPVVPAANAQAPATPVEPETPATDEPEESPEVETPTETPAPEEPVTAPETPESPAEDPSTLNTEPVEPPAEEPAKPADTTKKK